MLGAYSLVPSGVWPLSLRRESSESKLPDRGGAVCDAQLTAALPLSHHECPDAFRFFLVLLFFLGGHTRSIRAGGGGV